MYKKRIAILSAAGLFALGEGATVLLSVGPAGAQAKLDSPAPVRDKGTRAPEEKPAARTFRFTYSVEIPVPDNSGEVKVWLPYPVSDSHQQISGVSVNAPSKYEVRKEPKYGNSVLFFAVEHPKEPVKAEISFDVKRDEYIHRPDATMTKIASSKLDASVKRWLEPDRLVPNDPKIKALADEVTKGKKTDLDKARAIYDYTVSTMKYDKSGTGWGNGDIFWACDAKRGNCTDFHALVIGLCRAEGIPARFSIGFPIPAERGEGEIGGYHCWAEFYLNGYGWVPLDASEACKNPNKKDYFFGAHDENRVQLTQGRDLRLEPPQAGDPLNYFVYPYIEIDGKSFKDAKKKFTYKDLDARTRTSVAPAAGTVSDTGTASGAGAGTR